MKTTLRKQDLDLLVGARHWDPFSVLGPHVVEEKGKRLRLRAGDPAPGPRGPGGARHRRDAARLHDPRPPRRGVRGALPARHGDLPVPARDHRRRRLPVDAARPLRVRNGPHRFRHPSPVRREPPGAVREAGEPCRRHRRDPGHGVRGVGAQRGARLRRLQFQPLGRPRAPDAQPGRVRDLGDLPPRRRRGGGLQVRDPLPGHGRTARQDRPVRLPVRAPAADGNDRLRHRRTRVGGRVLAGEPRATKRPRGAHGGVRGPPGLLETEGGRGGAVPVVPGAGRRPRSLRQGDGIHPHRAPPGGGASVRRFVGVPGARVLRADVAPRPPGRVHGVRRPVPPRGDRRDPRLGAGPLSPRRPRAGAVRRDPPLRARRPAAGGAAGLGNAHLQLRTPGGGELPPVERPLLAGQVPRRRPAGGRRGVDALPRLLPETGRSGSRTSTGGTRTSRRSPFSSG